MTIDQLVSYADLLAAIAVIVTVAFLASEMRQTRKQAELTNWRDLLQTLVQYKAATNDLAFAEFIERGHQDYAALTPGERRSFDLFLQQGVHVYGNFLKHNDALPRKLAGLDEAASNYFVDMLTTPGGAAWWAENRDKGHFMPDTYRTVDAILAKGRQPTAPPKG